MIVRVVTLTVVAICFFFSVMLAAAAFSFTAWLLRNVIAVRDAVSEFAVDDEFLC